MTEHDNEIPLEMVYWFFWDGVTAPPKRDRKVFSSAFSSAFDKGNKEDDD